jgi:hypothetical protein
MMIIVIALTVNSCFHGISIMLIVMDTLNKKNMDTQKNDPSKKGQNQGQANQGQSQNTDSKNTNAKESEKKTGQQGGEEEGTKMPGRETRTPVAGKEGAENKDKKTGNDSSSL